MGTSRSQRQDRAHELIKHVGLVGHEEKYPHQLSGGQQQRVAIARSLVNNPPLLLADEPTGNLDSRTGEEVLQMFQALNDNGLTIILVTHDIVVTNHAKRTIRIRDGLIESGAFNERPAMAIDAVAGGVA
jgi:putative ABC transport system ATP-binding protein